MKVHKTYSVRGYTNPAGYRKIQRVLGMCKTLYNACLEERITAWKYHGKSINYNHQQAQFKPIRDDDPEWKDISQEIGRGVLRRCERAFNGFFNIPGVGFPRFQSIHRYRTIELAETTPAMVKFDGVHHWLKVKGLPNIKLSTNRLLPLSTDLKKITVTYKGRNLAINLTYSVEVELLLESPESVGLDMGITDRVMLSTGEYIPRRRENKSLRKKQQRVSSCRKGSNTRRKRVRTLANAHRKERVSHRNETHRYTSYLIKRFQWIAVEALNIENMTRSAKGTVENPGKNVAQKTGLNREILLQGWGTFRQQLHYKAGWAGRWIVEVDPRYTSRVCSVCGIRGIRTGKQFYCPECFTVMDADWNGSRNVYMKAGGNKDALASPAGGVRLPPAVVA